MSKYLKQIAALILVCFFQVQYVFAQSVSTNHNGEKIVIYDDGSWRYYDESDPEDVELYRASDIYKEDDKKSKSKKVKSKKVKTKKPKSQKQKSKSTKYAKAKPKKKVKKSKSKKRGSSYSRAKESPNRNIDYGQKIRREIINIRDKQNMALEKERVASFATNKYEREYKIAQKRKLSKPELSKIEAKYKAAKLQLKMARTQNKILLKQRRAYESLQKKSPSSQAKSYAKLAHKYDKDFKIDPPKKQEELVVRENKNKKTKTSRSKSSKSSSTDEPLISSSSAYAVSYPSNKPNADKAAVPACSIAFQGKDSFSGKKRMDLSPSHFFSFTSKKMRSYFEEGDMVQCNAYMSAVSVGYKFICIEVTIASETAQKSYGSLEKQGMLSVKLVDGTNINLYNNKTDYGSLDPLKKTVLYKAQYLIPSEHVKTLSKVDIDKVRLVWSTGYEDYSIYETDFIINQLNCLEQ